MSLRQNIIRLTRDSAIYGLISFAGKALSLVTVPIFTRVFAPEDYGIMSLLGMVFGLSWPVMEMGMDCGVQLYFYREKDIEKRNGMIFSGLVFILVWATFLSAMLILLRRPISEVLFKDASYHRLVGLVLIVSYLTCYVNYCKYLLRLGLEAWKFVCVTIAHNFLGVGIGVYFVLILRLGIPGVYWGQFCACFASLFLLILWTRKYFSPRFSMVALGKFLKVGIPYVPTALIYIVATYVDRLFLARLATLSHVGLYAISMKLSNVLTMLRGMFQTAWGPIGLKLYYDDEDYQQTYKVVISGALLLFCFIAVSVTAFRHEILYIFTTRQYFGAHIAVGPLCLAEAVRGIYVVALIGVSIAMKTYWMLIFAAISLVVNAALNFVLIPAIGIAGAAISTSISIAVIVALAYIVSQRLIESIRFDWRRDLGIFSGAVFAIGLFYLTDLMDVHWLRLGANLMIVIAFPVVLFVSGLMDVNVLRRGVAVIRARMS